MEATDWEALKDPICDCENAIPFVEPMLLWEYDIGKLGRGGWWLLEAIAEVRLLVPGLQPRHHIRN